MKTAFLVLISLVAATQTNAASFNYTCAKRGGEEPMAMQIDEQSMTIINQLEGNGSTRRGNLVFLDIGTQGGNGKMSDQLVYKWSKPESGIYNWNMATDFFVQPALLSGGMRLHNGCIGGFISFTGEGYSYESYLCIRD